LLGSAAGHFVAGFQGHPRSGLKQQAECTIESDGTGVFVVRRAGLAALGDPNALEHFSVMGNRPISAGHCVNAAARLPILPDFPIPSG
jgi:hypothetical protein